MGTSTDAYLFFGFSFYREGMDGRETAPSWLKEQDVNWEDVYVARAHGLLAPENYCTEYGDRQWKYLDECPVEIGHHCSADYPVYFVALKKSRTTAHRGYPKRLNIIPITKKEVGQLKDFCKLMDIKWQEPRWWLASYMG